MYKQFLIPIVLLSAVPTMAQPVLTNANTNPTVGMTTTLFATTITSPGPSGANVTWNFATIPNNGSTTAAYMACSAAPDCNVMTGSNLAGLSQGNYAYYITSNNSYTLRGMKVNNIVFNYSNTEDNFQFPFTYNNTFKDSFIVNYTSGSPIVRKGEATVTADGWGTLILPTGTFTNVLRVHRVELYADFVSGVPMFNYSNVWYAWYQPGNHDIILSTSTVTIGSTTSSTVSYYSNQSPLGVEETAGIGGSLKVYPNPATDMFSVKFRMEKKGAVSITLTDIAGRLVTEGMNKEYNQGDHTETINTLGLAKGVYMLRVSAGGTNLTRRIEVL